MDKHITEDSFVKSLQDLKANIMKDTEKVISAFMGEYVSTIKANEECIEEIRGTCYELCEQVLLQNKSIEHVKRRNNVVIYDLPEIIEETRISI